VDATTKVNKRDVSTPELFTKRVVDELVRFPIRRKQLMRRGEISKVSIIVKPIRQGDQYIIPESSPTWTNLLRLDWAKQLVEEPRYYEEMSREEENVEKKSELPPELEDMVTNPNIVLSPEVPLSAFQGILGITFEQFGVEEGATILTKDNLIQYVKHTQKPIGMIDLINNTTQFIRPFNGSFDSVTIFVFLPDRMGLLMEESEPTVKIASLSEDLQEMYRNAALVQIKKVKVEQVEQKVVIGQNPPRRRPRVATENRQNRQNKQTKTRRRPRVASR
jgi:hypothetical protein